MPDNGVGVGALCSELGFSGSEVTKFRKEVRDFQEEYAEAHDISLSSRHMQDLDSTAMLEMVRTYMEEGLERIGIPPGSGYWAAQARPVRRGPDGERLEYPQHREK